MNPDEAYRDLLQRIQQKRKEMERFIFAELPRKRRLLNMTIVGGTLAATLTAVPAVGGQSVTVAITKVLGLGSPAWQLLCGAAAVSSVIATVSTQLLKSHNVDEHVAAAQRCRAKLEVIELGLETGQLDAPHATAEFIKCVEETASLEIRRA